MQENTSLEIETHTISKKVIGGVLVLVMALMLALIWQPDKATAANKKPSDLKMPKVGRIDELNTKASTFQVAYKEEPPEIQYQSVEAEIEDSRLMMQRRQASISVYKADNAPAVMEKERIRDINKEFASNPSVVQASAHQIENLDYTIIQGKIITGILESAINSDLPGYIRAIVKENVYAEHGANLLIPKGSRLIGYYKSELDVGQKRVFIVWQRLIRPDGIEVNLNSPGTNHLGQAGLTGGIDTHFFERFGEAILLSLISAGSANINVDKSDQYNSRSAYREAVSQSFADTASQSLNRTQGLGPTVHVPQGTIIKVFVAQDLNFYGALNKEVAHAKNIEALKAHLEPLKPFLDDDYVSEIILNRPQELFIERKGQFEKHVVGALDYNHLFRLVTLVANYNKKPFSDKVPRLSATLPQGYRLQALTPPVLEQGRFSLSIRKQVISDYTLDDYDDHFYENLKINDKNRLSNKSTAIELIRSCILNRKTILISGGTSTGKTTFLNACLKEIPLNERLITLEDTREIHVEHPNHCSLIAGYNGDEYSDQDMIENLKATLRLRPDRILLGELRGGEATTFLEAASTGHEGSFSTIHASSAKLALERVCMLAERGGLRQQSREELREYVLSIIDVVIQLKRLPDGTRQMTEILCKGLDR